MKNGDNDGPKQTLSKEITAWPSIEVQCWSSRMDYGKDQRKGPHPSKATELAAIQIKTLIMDGA
jgi:hypothetical protein